MKEISLHLLDLAENSVSAGAQSVHISVSEDFRADRLTVSVQDDGAGMSAEMVQQVTDPFFTSRTTRKVGLGIPLLKSTAEACHGGMNIQSKPGAGTRVEATFQHSHIDRMPLGDIASTFLTLAIAHPETHWIFTYTYNPPYKGSPRVFEFDDQPIKQTLDGFPLTHPGVIAYIRTTLEEGIAEARR
jgi:hypothetical protein